MINLDKLTMITPVMERQPNIPIFMKFHKGWNCQKIIADSSFEPYKEPIEETFKYIYYGPTNFFQKIFDIISKHVTTEYVFVTSDDDIAIPSCVSSCINFLETNKNFVLANGEWYWFKDGALINNYNLHAGFTKYIHDGFTHADPLARIQRFFSCYYPHMNSIVRTEAMLKVLEALIGKKFHISAFGDRIFPLFVLTYGNLKALDMPFIVQKYSDRVWGSKKLVEKLAEIYKDTHISLEDNLTEDGLRPFAKDFAIMAKMTEENAFLFIKNTLLQHYANERTGCINIPYKYKIWDAKYDKERETALSFMKEVERNLVRNNENL